MYNPAADNALVSQRGDPRSYGYGHRVYGQSPHESTHHSTHDSSHHDSGDDVPPPRPPSPVEQVQLALAIADEAGLKALLTDCTPPLAQRHRIGATSSTISIRLDTHETVDALVEFEDITCVPAESDADVERTMESWGLSASERIRELSRLTRCESDLQTLLHHATLAQTLSHLAHVGFSPQHIQDILHLPTDAWHKSWWYTLDDLGNFAIPFHRRIRTRRYADGTFTIQYKDYFPYEKPTCFKSRAQKVLVAIQDPSQGFGPLMSSINYGREKLGIDRAILIGDRLSELEARGFVSQGVSLYAASDLLLPTRANCMLCANHSCPMNHRQDSPVTTCRSFCLGEWQD